MQQIPASALIPMDIFSEYAPIEIDLAYAVDAPPNIFGKVYRDDARLWLHEHLARIIVLAAKTMKADGFSLVLYDGLRTSDAQAKMAEAPIVKANPQWMEEPNRLLSPPGKGAHPRGMAIDCTLRGADGTLLDMGTVFDHLAEIPTKEHNPAHRAYVNLLPSHKANRDLLNRYLTSAAQALETPLLLLATEWWDFRLPADIYEKYAPLSDAELPPAIGMVTGAGIDAQSDGEKKARVLKALERFA